MKRRPGGEWGEVCGCEDGRGDREDRRRDREGWTRGGRGRVGGEGGSRTALRIEEEEGVGNGGRGECAGEMTFTDDDIAADSVKVGRLCLVWVAW